MPYAATAETIQLKMFNSSTANHFLKTSSPTPTMMICTSNGSTTTASTGTTLLKYLLKPYESAAPMSGVPPLTGGGPGGGTFGGGGTLDMATPPGARSPQLLRVEPGETVPGGRR